MSTQTQSAIERTSGLWHEIKARVQEEIVGQDEVIELLTIGVFAGGHALLVGVPGLAKTLLVRTLAESLDLEFSRIQFTPDLMPSDIVGAEVIVEDSATGARHFRFMNGPVFANVVLADEINRTPPKTQAALIEAMEEHQVTVGGRRHRLEAPFFVLATQNPIEQEGTYPLPAAQLDRFTFWIEVDYPSREEERKVIRQTCAPRAPRASRRLVTKDDLLGIHRALREAETPAAVTRLATELARATRPQEPDCSPLIKDKVAFGVGPRGAQALVMAAKARAFIHGRAAPTLDDVKALLPHVFRHRLLLNFQGTADGTKTTDLLAAIEREVSARVG